MEELKLIFSILIILSVLARILNFIFEPLKIRELNKTRGKNRKNRDKTDKRIIKILQNKYDIDFYSDYTLIIYDFIKTYVEKINDEKIITYINFSQDDLLEYIDLYDEYSKARLNTYENYSFSDKIKKGIEGLVYNSLIEIKNYLYTKGIHFPCYKLSFGSNYINCDNSIKEEERIIKKQIEEKEKRLKYTKAKHYFYFFISFLFFIIVITMIIQSHYNIFIISISLSVIIFSYFIWNRDNSEYKSIINPLKQKLEYLISIPEDTYALSNKVKDLQ